MSCWPEATFTLLRSKSAKGSGRAALIVDGPLLQSPIVAAVRKWLDEHHTPVDAVLPPPRGGLAALRAWGQGLDGFTMCVAVGGGRLLDAVKLATVLGDPRTYRHLATPLRSGWVHAPTEAQRPLALVAVPTTLGTGAESSGVAVLDDDGRLRLVMAPALRPEAAVLDPLATESLPAYLVREGVLEILARLAGPYVGDLTLAGRNTGDSSGDVSACGPASLADALVEAAVADLVRVGSAVETAKNLGAPERLRVAEISAFAHDARLSRPASPWGSRLWPIANELSRAAGVRKMTASAALWPLVWRSVVTGDERFGSASRLYRLWGVVRSAYPGPLKADPADGLADLIARWHIRSVVPFDPHSAGRIARDVVRAWGAGLPALGGLGGADVLALLSAAVVPVDAAVPTAPGWPGVCPGDRAARSHPGHGVAAHAMSESTGRR